MDGNMALTGPDLTYDLDSRNSTYFRHQAWSMGQMPTQRQDPRRNISPIETTTTHGLRQTTMAEHPMMGTWRFDQQPHTMDFQTQPTAFDMQYDPRFHNLQLHPSQLAMMPVSQAPISSGLPLEPSYLHMDQGIDGMPQNWQDFQSELINYTTTDFGPAVSPYQQLTSSPTGSHLEVLSQPSSCDENAWTMVDHRTSFESYEHFFVDPNQTIHNRTLSESSYSDLETHGNGVFMSNLDISPAAQAVYSPTSLSDSDYECSGHAHGHRLSIDLGTTSMSVNPSALVRPIPIPLPDHRLPPSVLQDLKALQDPRVERGHEKAPSPPNPPTK